LIFVCRVAGQLEERTRRVDAVIPNGILVAGQCFSSRPGIAIFGFLGPVDPLRVFKFLLLQQVANLSRRPRVAKCADRIFTADHPSTVNILPTAAQPAIRARIITKCVSADTQSNAARSVFLSQRLLSEAKAEAR